ncbi:MAG: hypothetical protein WBD47_06500, partial [Phormidesmis sp.]
PFTLLADRSNRLNVIGLSWLHWGWTSSSLLGLVGGWGLWPVVATYFGTVGTTVNLTYQNRQLAEAESLEETSEEVSAETLEQRISEGEIASFDVLTVALTVLILLFRSLFVAQVPPHQLGLAVGICGWLLAWLNRNKANQAIWQWAGLGLLLLGWAVSVTHQPPWQAIGVSILALGLIWDRLQQTWEKAYLLALAGVAGQAYWLLGALIPPGTRETILTRLASQLSAQPITKSEWTSLGFFPFLLGLLLFAWQLRRWQKPTLSNTAEGLALALGSGLTLLSVSNRFTLAANLLLSAVTLFVMVRRRSHIPYAMVALTHGVGLMAVGACVDYLWPELTMQRWATVVLAGAIAQFGLHVGLRSDRWRRSTWQAGIALFALSYWLLYTRLYEKWGDHSSWIGLVAPATLTALTLSRRALWPQHLAKFTLVALLLQTPWLTSWPVAIASFAVGTLCMLIQSRQWQHQIAALFTVGSGVACVTCSLWYGLVELPAAEPGRLMIFWAVEIGALWLLAGGLARRSGRWMALYQRAANGWAAGLMVGLLTVGTAAAGIAVQENGPMGIGLTSGDDRFIRYILAASVVLMAAQIASIRSRNSGHRPAEWRYWSLAWAAQIAVTIGLALREIGVEGVAIATLILGAISLIIGNLLANRRQRPNRRPDNQQTNQQSSYRPSWHGIPVAYALLGSLLGHSLFLANSGFYTMAAAAIFLGVGRRQTSLRVLSYAGLVGFSVGDYELLVYRLLQASGGQPGDGLTLLAALALAIALIERYTSTWLTRYLRIPLIGLRWMAHAHWALGSLGVVAAAVVGVFAGMSQPQGIAIWTATSLLLAAYALAAGNRRWTSQLPGLGYAEWTTLGLLEALLCVAYDRFAWFFDRSVLLT